MAAPVEPAPDRSRLGEELSGARLAGVLAVLAAALGADVWLLRATWGATFYGGRLLLSALVVVADLALVRFRRRSLGLTAMPRPGHRYWLWAGALMGAAVLLFSLAAWVVFRLLGWPMPAPAPFADGWHAASWFVTACLITPLTEEVLYRLALCVPLAALLRKRWPVVLLSGAVFGGLHFLSGNPGPDNFIAGYLFAWAYLRSDSLLVPVVFHAVGNTFVLLVRLAL